MNTHPHVHYHILPRFFLLKVLACLKCAFGWESQNSPELNLAMSGKAKKDFCWYSNSKWKTRESVDSLLNGNGNGNLVTEDIEKSEMLNTFLNLIFTCKTSLQQSLSWALWHKLEQGRLNLSGESVAGGGR